MRDSASCSEALAAFSRNASVTESAWMDVVVWERHVRRIARKMSVSSCHESGILRMLADQVCGAGLGARLRPCFLTGDHDGSTSSMPSCGCHVLQAWLTRLHVL